MLSGSKLPDGPQALRHKRQQWNVAGRACRDAGVLLRLCSHHRGQALANGARALRGVLNRADPELVFLVLDVGNLLSATFEAPHLVGRHSKRIAAFHLRNTIEGQEVRIGEGKSSFARLAAALRETGRSGWLIVEVNRDKELPSWKWCGGRVSICAGQ